MRASRFLLVALGLALPRLARGQESAYRFPIAATSDSTFSFSVKRYTWIRSGLRGIAVDPIHRDALVARFQIVSVDSGKAVALVTGQTTRLSDDHMALLERPRSRWYTRRDFWAGTLLGAAVGVFAATR